MLPNYFSNLWQAMRGVPEQKFTPADPTVNWTYVQHLVDTANTVGYWETNADANSAVFACLRALAYATVEAPLKVFTVNPKGEREEDPENPIQQLLDNPHPELDLKEIIWWLAWARHADGNAYLQKVRAQGSRNGPPLELWPVSPRVMRPKTERGSNNFIDYYERDSYDGPIQVPVEDVLHFKLGVDPYDPRKGISPIKRLVREIHSDSVATQFSDALLGNFGIPGLVVKLPAESNLSPRQQDDLKRGIEERFTSANRGRVGVLTGGADMEQFGFSPDQLNLKVLHDVPETRIAAVMGVDQLIARLGVGLEQMSNYASARQVRENFTELTVIPLWAMDESKWNRKLKPDFTSDRNTIIAHDLSEVRALQEDQDAKWTRVTKAWQAGLMTREMCLRELGVDPDLAEDEILLVPANTQYVAVSQATTDVEAQAALDQQNAEADRAARAQALRQNPNPPAGPPPAKGLDPETYSQVIQDIVDTAAVQMADDLERYQVAQQKRITKAMLVNGTSG